MWAKLKSRTNTYGLSGKLLRIAITATAVSGFSLFGYDQGLMSGLISADKFNEEFPATRDNGTIQGAVTASYELGCFFGALFALMKGERTGRRPLVFVGSILIIVGAIISTTPVRPHWPLGHFVVGRVITGLGNGLNTATIPVWQSEMSRAENRGFLVNMEGAFIAVGTFVAYWVDFGFSYADSSILWRFPVAFQVVFALFVFVGIIGLPESPRWLIKNHHEEDAKVVLAALRGVEVADDTVTAEFVFISDSVRRSAKLTKGGISQVFTGGKTAHWQRMVIGASTQFFQQLTGCNAAIYYSTLLFYQTIFNHSQYRLSMILGGVFATIYALATIPSFFLIDTLGRRKLFLIGATGQGVAFTISFACLIDDTEQNAKGAAVGIFLFIVFFAFTILPLPWIYPPEINPLKTRTYATAISTCTNWLMNFAVVMFVPRFLEASNWGCYLFFAVVNFCFVPVIFFFYPETAGRSLEEIDVIFAKAHVEKRQPWRVAATLPKLSHDEVDQYGRDLGLYGEGDEQDFEKQELEVEDNSEKSMQENQTR
ncbi:sugar transporter-like protein [Lodderomyces elongisporus]|uniref:sugar transporter-like protein n=1 Tax=Lodderomyces elongisporus TaxID=36914 RepID=UPI00291CDFB2|nr:sugar transporter-like protein [Lodderomyces elongisporus]WLF81892.1 sugar transporter-like protein [Lodderomyces elongisporus]